MPAVRKRNRGQQKRWELEHGQLPPTQHFSTAEHRQMIHGHRKTITAALDDSSPAFPTVVLWAYPAPRCHCTETVYCAPCRADDASQPGLTNQQRRARGRPSNQQRRHA